MTEKSARPFRISMEAEPEARLVAVVVTTLVGSFYVWLSASRMQEYGASLFIGLPFALGLIFSLIYGWGARRPLGRTIAWQTVPYLLSGIVLLAFRVEGMICMIMALPLALPLGAAGCCCGWLLLAPARMKKRDVNRLLPVLIGIIPALMGAEAMRDHTPPLYEVTSVVEIGASPETVWREVIAFSELPAPTSWIFKTGLAYPLRAEIEGEGVGAIRRCIFSTGAFVEPIEVWDPPRLLEFSVLSQPPPMKEWSPWRDISPPHLHGFFMSERGRFLLTPLPGGSTRLEGTTWYRHDIAPAAYWRLWSDRIIHRIHMRVLEHIRRMAESVQP